VSKLLENLPPIQEQLIGHRGAAGLAPENTLSSFVAAAKLGLTWVEFDIQQCSTGEWLVFHDETLNRTTNGNGLVEETPYETIKKLDAGLWFSPHYKNEPIPLLSEALSCLIDLHIHPNIEIKSIKPVNNNTNNNKRSKVHHFLQQLQVIWPNTLPPPLISSFDWEILMIIRSLNANLPLGFIIEDYPSQQNNIIDRVQQNGLNSLHCDRQKLLASDLHYANTRELPLLVYTVNEPEQIKNFLQAGVTALFSDLTFCIPKPII
jgi:glycerophosphoryl diester phosphodiesterase